MICRDTRGSCKSVEAWARAIAAAAAAAVAEEWMTLH